MGLVNVKRAVAIVVKLVPNLLNYCVDYVAHVFIVLLVLAFRDLVSFFFLLGDLPLFL